jgi:hypothetical protein
MNTPTIADLTYIDENAFLVCACCGYLYHPPANVVYDGRDFCSSSCVDAVVSDEAITPEEREESEAEEWEAACAHLRSIGH